MKSENAHLFKNAENSLLTFIKNPETSGVAKTRVRVTPRVRVRVRVGVSLRTG